MIVVNMQRGSHVDPEGFPSPGGFYPGSCGREIAAPKRRQIVSLNHEWHQMRRPCLSPTISPVPYGRRHASTGSAESGTNSQLTQTEEPPNDGLLRSTNDVDFSKLPQNYIQNFDQNNSLFLSYLTQTKNSCMSSGIPTKSHFKVPKSLQIDDCCHRNESEKANKINTKEPTRREPPKPRKCVIINTWEEFYYGISVLDDNRTNLPGITSCTNKIHRAFARFLPRKCVEFFVAFVYLVIFFISCLAYNMFWQCIGYMLLKEHLQIHALADKRRIDILFKGSVFQGPAYVYMRQVWCAHCAQQSTMKITSKLMKDYREEYEQRKRAKIVNHKIS